MTSQEESDLAKAIALSLKESNGHKSPKKSSIYPSVASGASNNEKVEVSNKYVKSKLFQEPRKVKALYDFEAAEENEVTFKAGEVVSVLDDSDPNWWRGSTWRGEGLFPANFVTADLSAELEQDNAKRKKSVSFDNEVKVVEAPPVLEVDETKINETLETLQNVDPTADSDAVNLLQSEEQCRLMAPLIDQELEQVDRHHLTLMDLNSRLSEAFQMYTSLMMNPPTTHFAPPSTHYPPSTTQFPQPPFPPSTNQATPYNTNYTNGGTNTQYNALSYPPYDQASANMTVTQYQIPAYTLPQQQQIDTTTTMLANSAISDQQHHQQHHTQHQQQYQQFSHSNGLPYANMQTPTPNLL